MTVMHELAHIRRSDWLVQTLAQLAAAAYWFHPLAWFAAARIRLEADRACDDLVIDSGEAASGYAEHLVRTAREYRDSGLRPWNALAMATPSTLDQRIRYLLDAAVQRGIGKRGALAATISVALLAVGVASMEAVRAAEPIEPVIESAEPAPVRRPVLVAQAEPAPRTEPAPPTSPERRVAQAAERTQANAERARRAGEEVQRRAERQQRAAERQAHVAMEKAGFGRRVELSDESKKAASAALLKALKSPDKRVRIQAAEALGRLGSAEQAVRDGLRAALSDAEPEVQRAATEAFGRIVAGSNGIPPAEAIGWLAPLLKSSDVRVRREAVKAIGRLKGPEAIAAVSQAMTDSEAAVQYQAVESLGRLLRSADADTARASLPALARILEHKDAKIRRQVVETLGGLRKIANEVIPLLAKAVDDPDVDVQRHAVEALGNLSGGGFGPRIARFNDSMVILNERMEGLNAQMEPLVGLDFDFGFDWVRDMVNVEVETEDEK